MASPGVHLSSDVHAPIVSLLLQREQLSPGRLVQMLQARGQPGITADRVVRALQERPDLYRLGGDEDLPLWALVDPLAAGELLKEADGRTTPHAASRPGLQLPELFPWQREALAAWASAGSRGVVEAVTGTGKTMVGLAAIAQELERGGQVLVIVPTTALQEQWIALFRRYGPGLEVGALGGGRRDSLLGCAVLVAVVNSARDADYWIGPTSLIVADECHRYGSEGNAIALDPRFERRLGLSATYARPDDGHETILDPYFGGVVYRLGYRRAAADGIVAPFTVAMVGVRLDGPDRAAYDEASETLRKAREALIHRFGVPEEPIGEFMRVVSELAEAMAGDATFTARRFLAAFTERRRILAEAPAKLQALDKVAPALVGAERTLVFSETIEGATRACEALRRRGVAAAVVHSENSQPERRATLERFRRGDVRVLAAPRVLDEGIDVPEADLAVIVSASRTRRQMVQRMGRVIRRKADGRAARFAVLYVEDTIEDPARGAHHTFLDEISEVARIVRRFDADASMAAVCGFLLDFAQAGDTPAASGLAARPEPEPSAPHGPAVVETTLPATAGATDSAGRSPTGDDAVDDAVDDATGQHAHLPWMDDRKLRESILLVRERDRQFSAHEASVLRATIRGGLLKFRDLAGLRASVRAPAYAAAASACEDALARLDDLDPEVVGARRRAAAAAEARQEAEQRSRAEAERDALLSAIETARAALAASDEPAALRTPEDRLRAAIGVLDALRPSEWRDVEAAWTCDDERRVQHNVTVVLEKLRRESPGAAIQCRKNAFLVASRVRKLSSDLDVARIAELYLVAAAAGSSVESWRRATMSGPVETVARRAGLDIGRL